MLGPRHTLGDGEALGEGVGDGEGVGLPPGRKEGGLSTVKERSPMYSLPTRLGSPNCRLNIHWLPDGEGWSLSTLFAISQYVCDQPLVCDGLVTGQHLKTIQSLTPAPWRSMARN